MTFVDVPAWQRPRQTEASFLEQVRTYARLMGWRSYHTRRSEGSDPGFPDLVLVRPPLGPNQRPRVVYAELKAERTPVTDDQKAWLSDLRACGQEVFLWRPRDWRTIEKVLAR